MTCGYFAIRIPDDWFQKVQSSAPNYYQSKIFSLFFIQSYMPSERYCRQITLIGEASQQKLAEASVLVIGAGGIGSPCLLYLGAGGIGKIGIIDHDLVTLSNLHRQILYTEHDIGSPKSSIAYQKLTSLNSNITLCEYNSKLTIENATDIISNYDLIIDGSDNFKTRYLVNDICCQLNKPFISSSIFQNRIQTIFFDITHGCYRCVFPEPPPPFLMNNCSEAGVLGAVTGIAGSITAALAIKYLINQDDIDIQKIITFNGDNFKTEHFAFSKKELCSACHHKSISWPTKDFNLNLQNIDLTNYMVIDIRENNEDRKIKLTDKELHIPFSQLLELPNYIPHKKLLIYCISGLRSDYAAHFLNKNGFQAYSLEKGSSSLIPFC
jgi:sulfur-carrier protein adenylyltransferase/sulfurtransferase